MSYRAPEQELESPIDKILEGINNFRDAAKERMESGEWQEKHLVEIDILSHNLLKYERQLVKIKNDTW